MKQRSAKFNASMNVIKSVSSILLTLITAPYLTRVLQAESYGKVGFAVSIVSYFQLLAALGVASYAMREGAAIRNNQEKINAFSSRMFSINILSTAFSYVLLFILLVVWRGADEYRDIILVQSVTIVLTTLSVDWVFNIYENYTYITIRTLVFQALTVPLIIILVKNPADYLKYVLITVMASLATCICNYVQAKKYVRIRFTWDMELARHIQPIMILFANTALITLYLNSDTTILGIFKGDVAVGLYSVSVKIYTIVKNVINAVVVALIPRIAFYLGEGRMEDYREITSVSLKAILTILFPSLTGLLMVSENAILLLAGKEYIGGTLALQILSIALFFAVIANFFVNGIMLTHRMEKIILTATVVSALLNVGLNLICIPMFSLNGAAFTTLLAEMTVAAISIYSCRKVFDFHGYLKTILSVIIGCIGIVIVCIAIDMLGCSLLIDTLLKVAASAVVYVLAQLIINKEFIIEFMHSK